MNALYCDGGVIGRNPSAVGGTYAFRIIENDLITIEQGGIITAQSAQMETVSNNLTEMLALVCGLNSLPFDWVGTVYSDSQITLGRAFLGWKWNNIPGWLKDGFESEKHRFTQWDQIQHVLLDGHPTRAELAKGIGSRGHPVSEHNVWCDLHCQKLAKQFTKVPF